jgi:hypothetical protein
VLKFRKGIVKFYANIRDVDYVLSAYKKINTHCCSEFVTLSLAQEAKLQASPSFLRQHRLWFGTGDN